MIITILLFEFGVCFRKFRLCEAARCNVDILGSCRIVRICQVGGYAAD